MVTWEATFSRLSEKYTFVRELERYTGGFGAAVHSPLKNAALGLDTNPTYMVNISKIPYYLKYQRR